MTTTNVEKEQAAEAAKLAGEVAQMKAAIERKDAEIAAMDARRTAAELKGAMLKALEKAGCRKAELAFRAFGDSLKLVDGGRVVGTGKVDGLTLELGVDEFVTKIVKPALGEFFARPSAQAPASSGAGKEYDFTEEQVANSEFYQANRAAIIKALESGRVRPRQGRR